MELAEAIEKNRLDRVELLRGPRSRQVGSLVLTGHHLIFAPEDPNSKANEFWLLHRAVDRVTTEPSSPSTGSPSILYLKCKNFLICAFSVQSQADCNAVARSIERLSNLSNLEFEYPFYHPRTFETPDDGWTAFDIKEQFASLMLVCNDRWRISAVNKNFEVCPTYPEHVIVPQGIGDDFLRISATYRDGSRFPVLAYYHKYSKSCIMRCGQPLVSPTNRRCKEDEIILNSLLSPQSKGVIYDTRSESVAVSARAKGGGKEQRYHYSQWHYVHGNLPRIREFKESLTRLIEACVEYRNSDKWLNKLTNSLWLQYVCDALTGAGTIAQWIHCGDHEKPVVVHGGESVDTTLLVTSISQILLDTDARTVRGFQAIIEREWILAGHPFHTRCSHAAFAQGTLTGPFEAPIFICFLDCVWQLIRQYPTSFEFSQEFLIFVAEHTYASEFGSFLGDNERSKKEHRVKERTASLWSYVNHPKILDAYINPIYKPYDAVIWPSVSAQSIVLWERFYLRWQRNWAKQDEIFDRLVELKLRETELRSRLSSKSAPKQTPNQQKNGSLKQASANASPPLLTGLEEKIAAI